MYGVRRVKEFRVEFRIKNNLLYRAIEAAGFDSASAFGRHCNISPTTVGHFLNLKVAPIAASGDWRYAVLAMATALKCLPDNLFPADYMRQTIKQNRVAQEYSAEEINEVMEIAQIAQATPEALMIRGDARGVLDAALGSLTSRERFVLTIRMGLDGGKEHTLEDVAQKIGTSRERIRQIEAKAIRKLKHPSRGLTPGLLHEVAE